MTGYALTGYGYGTVALAARDEPSWDEEAHEVEELEHLGLDPDHDEDADERDRDAPSLDASFGLALAQDCPDWPHRYPCDYCGGNGCRVCGGTGEREDPRPCRHP